MQFTALSTFYLWIVINTTILYWVIAVIIRINLVLKTALAVTNKLVTLIANKRRKIQSKFCGTFKTFSLVVEFNTIFNVWAYYLLAGIIFNVIAGNTLFTT